MKRALLTAIILLLFQKIDAQNSRLNTSNSIGWYHYSGTFKIAEKLGIHTEYQWRRTHFITDRQQNLFRTGINYHVNPGLMLRVGYARVETFPYGEIPLNGIGRDFTEHRIFEMLQLSHKEGVVDFTHRFMLEQRFIGRYSSTSALQEDEFPMHHRMRYMVRSQIPLNRKVITDETLYAALYDELFVGFGKNVNNNVFDQNRIGILLGYRFNKNLRIEGGYLNQTLQYSRQISNRNVFQNNNGFIFNTLINLDLTKK